jgi:hypothetical protein
VTKVVVVVSSGPHAHDYGVDYLLDGLRQAYGAEQVFDFPEKPCLHLAPGAPRDACNIDSDAWWPSKGERRIEEVVAGAEVVLLGVGPGDALGAHHARGLVAMAPRAALGALDLTDDIGDQRDWYATMTHGRAFVYFKRELPLGATWGVSCPLTYPAHKAPATMEKGLTVFYHATDHAGGAPGIPRRVIVEGLRQSLPEAALDVQLTPSQEGRLSPEAYHARMARAVLGVSWNGAPNWDCNRVWENFAFGLGNIMERPRMQMPFPVLDQEHAIFCDDPRQVGPSAKVMMSSPADCLMLAERGRRHFLAYHATHRRAAYVVGHL